ncbi:MAG TPA: hypothetical protein VEZ41_05330, partial [Allosphingosinicella sp.]|nr:hypothetical protein [Allosphingosinicella sp.]
MNNKQVRAAIESRVISINPFNEDKLKNIHYSLTVEKVLEKSLEKPDGSFTLKSKKDFSNDPTPYIFEPNEFVVVEIEEHISLKESVVGHFIPSSTVVTKGLSLIAGRIEAPFGNFKNRKQMIRFGMKNLTDAPVRLADDDLIAHAYFVDLRGLDNMQRQVSAQEERFLQNWTARRYRADSDGPDYGSGK